MQTKENVRNRFLAEIEKSRSSRLIACVWGCRNPFFSQPAGDFIRPFMDHLENVTLEKKKKVDIFLQGSGGTPEWALRAMGLIREYCDEAHAILPFSTAGAPALLAAGCDRLLMGKYSVLSATDGFGSGTQTTGMLQKNVLEQDDANLKDTFQILRRLLTSRRDRTGETQLKAIESAIACNLTRHEAKAAGLPLTNIKADLDDSIWNLYRAYEKFLELRRPIHAAAELDTGEEKVLESVPLAIIESRELMHIYRASILIRKIRQAAENPKVEIKLNLRVPAKTTEVLKSAGTGTAADTVFTRQFKPKLEKTIKEMVTSEWTRQSARPQIVIEIIKADWQVMRRPM